MLINKGITTWMVSGILGFVVSTASADNTTALTHKPDFADYSVNVSPGPFTNKLHLTDEQKNYSEHWKMSITKELAKPVNFAGHYRVYAEDKGQGVECQRGVCGWVLDKLSGTIVSGLPENNGSNSYGAVGDNGSPMGKPLDISTRKNSSLMVLTGQAIPQKMEHDKDGFPITNPCETTYHVFKKNQFIRAFEDKNGCSTD